MGAVILIHFPSTINQNVDCERIKMKKYTRTTKLIIMDGNGKQIAWHFKFKYNLSYKNTLTILYDSDTLLT